MTITSSAQADAKSLTISCAGNFSVDSFMDFCKGAIDLAANHGCKLLLLDARPLSGVPPNTIERFLIGSTAAEYEKSKEVRLRVALVGCEPYIDPERFGELVARNRGMQVQVFTDLDEAEKWLHR